MHMVETMAYNRIQKPWHGLGYPVDGNLTPIEMMQAAKVDWTVTKKPAVVEINGEYVKTGKSALIRESNNQILDVISDDWNPTQNQTAFEFFHDFVDAGQMSMETAGSLDNGRVVWALAKINQSFEAVRDDVVEGYLLFSNPHKYGRAITVRFTPIRVVCHNTLTFALSSKLDEAMSVSVNHRQVFDPELVKGTLKIATDKLDGYKETAQFLSSKQFDQDSVVKYLKAVFPKTAYTNKNGVANDNTELSRPAEKVLEVLNTQPGVDFGRGTYWQLFNAVTYATDHKFGRSADTRLSSAWYGINQQRKINALNTAMEMAKAA